MKNMRGLRAASCLVAGSCWVVLSTVAARAQDVSNPSAVVHTSPPPPDPPSWTSQRVALAPMAVLPPAAVVEVDRLEAMRARNVAGAQPPQNGFARNVSELELVLDSATADLGRQPGPHASGWLANRGGRLIWNGMLAVTGAHAFRIRLDDVELPPDAKLWVFEPGASSAEPVPPVMLDPEGGVWLPPVFGDTAVLELEVPASAVAAGSRARFRLHRVLELFDLRERTSRVWTSCDLDATCTSVGTLSCIGDLRESDARLAFVVSGNGFLCSGGFINDLPPTNRPYLLTANHCFSSQSSASSLVAYFDFRSSTCNGAEPSLASVPKVTGSTLRVTGTTSDFTLVELNNFPTGASHLLGWTTATPSNNQAFYRISHPEGTSQKFTQSTFKASPAISCVDVPTSDYRYSDTTAGSVVGGSSGAPVVDSACWIRGQLRGNCHLPSFDDCNYATFGNTDGAFSSTYPFVRECLSGGCGPVIFSDGFETDLGDWSATVP